MSPPQAPLGRRFAAGAFDFFVLWALVLASFLVPLFTRGLVLPMWGVLLVMLGYQVVPLSAFRQTLGMTLFGLELVTREGHAVGAGEVLFRELIGRGFFPAAFLGTLLLGFIASLLRMAAFMMPTGIGSAFFLICSLTVACAVLGHFLVFNRSDGRTLADLIAKSYVTARQARPAPDDAEEAAYVRSLDRKRVRSVALFEVVCVGLVFFGPWLLTQKVEGVGTRAERLKLRAQEEKAKSYPDDMGVLRELYGLQRALGQHDEAAATQLKLDALLVKQEAEREAALRRLLLADPSDRRAIGSLLELLEDKGRRDDARAAYQKYVEDNPRPSLRAGFAMWLSERGWHEDAIGQLKQALGEDPELGGGHTMLAELYEAADQPVQAHQEYYVAARLDPEDEDALEGLARHDAEYGALDKAARLRLSEEAKFAPDPDLAKGKRKKAGAKP